jgi:hemoglobin
MIAELVDAFYARVRADTLLGPVFDGAVKDWSDHLGRMRDFWSSVTLMSGRYKGKPIPAHVKLADIGAAHFERWLDLFFETAREVCPPQAAAVFASRAERIAESLQLGIAFHRQSSGQSTPAPAGFRKQRRETETVPALSNAWRLGPSAD